MTHKYLFIYFERYAIGIFFVNDDNTKEQIEEQFDKNFAIVRQWSNITLQMEWHNA